MEPLSSTQIITRHALYCFMRALKYISFNTSSPRSTSKFLRFLLIVFLISRLRIVRMGLLILRLSLPKKDCRTSCSSFFISSSATLRTISRASTSTSPLIRCFMERMVFSSSLLGSSFLITSASVKSSVIPYLSSACRSIISTVCLGNSFLIFCSHLGTVSLEPSLPPPRSCLIPCSSPYSLSYR